MCFLVNSKADVISFVVCTPAPSIAYYIHALHTYLSTRHILYFEVELPVDVMLIFEFLYKLTFYSYEWQHYLKFYIVPLLL